MESVLEGQPSEAICEAARRFAGGLVEGQSPRFAPAVAEFAQEVRRIAALLQYRGRPALPKPKDDWKPQPPEERMRMGFRMSMLSAGLSREGGAQMVKAANEAGMSHLIELAREWKVPVPDGLNRDPLA